VGNLALEHRVFVHHRGGLPSSVCEASEDHTVPPPTVGAQFAHLTKVLLTTRELVIKEGDRRYARC
jgi:hypothetical protein